MLTPSTSLLQLFSIASSSVTPLFLANTPQVHPVISLPGGHLPLSGSLKARLIDLSAFLLMKCQTMHGFIFITSAIRSTLTLPLNSSFIILSLRDTHIIQRNTHLFFPTSSPLCNDFKHLSSTGKYVTSLIVLFLHFCELRSNRSEFITSQTECQNRGKLPVYSVWRLAERW